jgi:hypothetical protein
MVGNDSVIQNDSIIQMVLLFVLVLERIFKLFVNSHCYKKLIFKSSLGNFEIETEEQPENDDKKEEKE